MKILKSFSDPEYAKSRTQVPQLYDGIKYHDPYILWGIGDDNKLYIKCAISGFVFPDWYPAEKIGIGYSWQQMQKIVDKLRV